MRQGMRIHAIIVAAGSGIRAGGGVPKQYRHVAGQPLLRHAVRRLLDHPAITGVTMVINPECRALYDAAVAGLGLPEPIAGGATRQESVLAGLEALAANPPEIVLVHDAARAFVPDAVIDALVAAFEDASVDGACPALPQVDSLRRGEEGRFSGSVDRDNLWRVQTPQAFRFPAILSAHRAAAPGATDEVAIALAAGLSVAITPGDERAFKVTLKGERVEGEGN